MLALFDLNPKDRLVAQLLLSQGVLSQEHFRQAMEKIQQSFFFSLAEILVGQGLVTLTQLEEILHDYCRKLRLGELALAKGLISETQLELALAAHDGRDSRIGEIFVELHLLTPQQIDTLVDFQRRCRTEAAAC